ncbi:sulfotransferase domain-containing protein [Solwaraspora sp. WMMD406]|uniref:sulfotransferase domain-containing protein n=1 Tax=Solwaraspora sp. WMMD406 TaxID=3016095 RepID=UPI002417F5E2|nr:sulfotransferase domain-containing protein [Solwaraspora sp. WMMD406]MDG4765699.1 sulfotransferase domain-containing protein [Solwaraspora sp. WMMD406]
MSSAAPGRAIIISSGRCGSTLLSDLIVAEPETLSVQEFFMATPAWAKSGTEITGEAYWAVLSSPKPELSTLFTIGLPPKEVRYPSDGRWSGALAELPQLLAITLPKLTDDPDALFDELADQVPAFPVQSFAAHHRMFLDLLTRLTGKRRWVERSGGSSQIAPYLLRSFGDTKIVYLTRNWPDTARSMSRHPSFQLIQLRLEFVSRCGIDPFQMTPDQKVPAELEHLLPDRITADLLRERGEDSKRYLGLCAFMSAQAEQALVDNPPAQLLTMRYEDLVADPVPELNRLGEFLDFADPDDWARQVAGQVSRGGAVRQPAVA